MRRLKVFLSYSSKDKHVAGEYKNYLSVYCGFEVYIAHEDNTPAHEWTPQIKDNISVTDIFIVLISKNSKISNYVNQEIGIAFGLDIKIFPIMIDETTPFGFIDRIHGFPYIKESDLSIIINCSKLFSIITTDTIISREFDDLAIDSAIYALSKSKHWRDTNVIIKLLMETEESRNFNQSQLTSIKSACCSNSEVYGGANAYPGLKRLLETKYGINGLI